MKVQKFIGILLAVLFIPSVLFSQEWNPPFPRTMYFSPAGSSGSARDYFLSKYDLVQPCGGSKDHIPLADSTRKWNPNIIIGGTSRQGVWPGNDPPGLFVYHATFLNTTTAISPGDSIIPFRNLTSYGFPTKHKYALLGADDWIKYDHIENDQFVGVPVSGDWSVNYTHPAGDSIKFPCRMSGFGMLHNITSLAPKIDGKEAWRWFVDNRFQLQDFSAYDVVFYDAFRLKLYADDVERQAGMDLDFDRIDDFDEHGLNWINARWEEGATQLLVYEHQRMQALHPGQQASETLNTGTVEDGYVLDYADGMLWEGFMRFAYDWYSMVNINLKWEKKQKAKGRTNFTMICDYEKESRSHGRDQFNRMRYGLTTALISGAFYGRTFGDWYYIGYYHDEFDANLGYPTGDPVELPSGAWVRFFDNGAAICNPTGQIITVNASELEAQPGYDGPYYRMRGGQDPDFNNGELFTSVQLYGEVRNPSRPRQNQGDGILLFKQPTTVVADIWIGNTYNNDTSPGNDPVVLSGNWTEVRDAEGIFPTSNRCFSQWSHTPYNGATYDDGIGYAYAPAGDGSSTATFRPNIGVEGYYEISEWHGFGTNVATNTPFQVVVNGEVKISGVIDQTRNIGRWNKIAYMYLPRGNTSYVRINNKANGYVLADAIMFHYMGESVTPDRTPPNPPQNIRILRYGNN